MKTAFAALVLCVCLVASSTASAAGARGKVEKNEFFQTRYGTCYTTVPAEYRYTWGPMGSMYAEAGMELKDGSVDIYKVTGGYVQIGAPPLASQSRRDMKFGAISCTPKNPHLKRVQNCRDTKLQNGLQRRCQVEIEDKGRLGWYDGTLVITKTEHIPAAKKAAPASKKVTAEAKPH